MKLYYIAVYILAFGLSNSWWNPALAIDSDPSSGGSSLSENEATNIYESSSGQGTDTHLADNCQESQSSSLKAIELDINTTVSTDDFDIVTSVDVKSFTPKHGSAFSKVVEIEANSLQTKELYHTSDSSKFLTKVEYNTNNHQVELYIGNETYKLEKVPLQDGGGKQEWVSHSLDLTVDEDAKKIEDLKDVIEKRIYALRKDYRKENELDRVINDLQRLLKGLEQLEYEIKELLSKGHKKEQLRKVKNDMDKEREGLKTVVNEVNKLNKLRANVIKREIAVVKCADKTVEEWDQVAGIVNDQFNAKTVKWEEDKLQDFKREVDELMKESIKSVSNELKEKRQNLQGGESNFESLKSEVLYEMDLEELEKLKKATKTNDEIKDMVKANELKKKKDQVDIDMEVDELSVCIAETKETEIENKVNDELKVLTESELKELEQWKRELEQELNQIMNVFKLLKESNGSKEVTKLDFEEFKEFISEFERELELAMYDMDEMNELENVGNIESLVDLKKLKEATIKMGEENKNVEKEVKEIEKIGNIMNPAELEELKTDLEEELKWVTDDVIKIIEKARNEDEVKERVKNVQKQKAEELKKRLKEVDLQLEDRNKVEKELEEKDLAKVLYELTKDLEDDSECDQVGNNIKETSENQQQSNQGEKKSESQEQTKENENNEQMESSELTGSDPSSRGTTSPDGVSGSDTSQSGGGATSSEGSTSGCGQSSEGSGSSSSGSTKGSTAKTGVDIDLTSHTQTTSEFEYNKDGDYVSYTAKSNHAFKSVKDGSDNVWQATDASEYSEKIEVETSGDVKSVSIHIGGAPRIFTKDGSGEPWNEMFTDRINPKAVNIKATTSIYFYSNELQGTTRTFEAQEGFAFNEVTDGTGTNKVVIWKASDVSNFAHKVVVDGDNKVTIHIGDDSNPTTKVFDKGSDNKWTENTSTQSGSSSPGTPTSPGGSSSSTATSGGSSEGSGAPSPDVLNITSQAATNDFDFKKDGNYVTFTAKGGNKFKSVKDDKIEVWKASDDTNVSEKVEVDNMYADAKAITIYLPGNKTKVFTKGASDSSFTELDTTKVHPKAVNIKRKDTTHFYTNILSGSTRTFTPRLGFGFNVVIDTIEGKSVDIWKKEDQKEYPLKIVVEGENKVLIHFGDPSNPTIMEFNKATNNKWNEKRSGTNKTVFDLNITAEQSADEFELTKDGKYYTYKSKGNYTFKSVKDANTKVWEVASDNIYSDKVEVDNIFSHSKAVTVFLDNNETKIFKKDYQSSQLSEIDISKVNPVSINIKREHMSYFCTNKLDNSIRTFDAKKGFLFNEVMESIEGAKVEIWKASKEKEFASKVEVEGDNKVTIHSADKTKKVFNKGSDGKWEHDTSSQSAGQAKSTQASTSGGSSDCTSTAKTGFDLDISSDASTNEFDFKKDGNFVTYTPKGDIAFQLVKDGSTNIWKASDASNFSAKVEVDNMFADAKAITIYLPGNKTKVFTKGAGDSTFTEIDTSLVHPKVLNIKRKDTTHFFFNKLENNIYTFTPKPGFGFSEVIDTLQGKSVEIWKKGNSIEYPSKVEVDSDKKVTIHFVQDSKPVTKVFVRDDLNDPWDPIDISKINFRPVNISETKITYFFSFKFDNKVRSYEAKQHFAFNIVKDSINSNLVEIWKASNDNQFTRKVEVEGDGVLTIHFGEGNKASKKVFMRDAKSDPWDAIDLSKLNPRSVNVKDTKQTYFYKNEVVNDARTFEAKDKFAFNNVKDGNTDLWSTSNVNELANKVVFVKRHTGSLDITIHLPNNKKKLFVKETSAASWVEIDLTKKNPKPVNIKDVKDTYFYINKFENDTRTFDANVGFVFNNVKDANTELWSTSNENEYASKVVFVKRHSGSLDITIHLPNNKKKLFVKETSAASWVEIDLTKKNPKPVNFKDDKDTFFFTYKSEDDTKTFQASDGFSFNSVKDGSTDLWSTTNESEYAIKLVSVKYHSGSFDLTIHLPNNNKKLFVKETSSSSWIAIDLNIKNTKPVNIMDDKVTYFYSFKSENDSRSFAAKDGFFFNKVLEGSTEIWKTTKDDKLAKNIIADGNEVTIHSGEGDKASVIVYVKQEDGKWKNTSGNGCSWDSIWGWISGLCSNCGSSSSSSSPSELNIKSDKATENFDYKKSGSYVTYTAKGSILFDTVIDDKTEVWATSDTSQRSSKVEVDLMNNSAKAVTIFLPNNNTKVFKKDGADKPWKEIDTTKVNTVLVDIKNQHCTYFCSNILNDTVRTFEARKGFVFNGMREENTHIWATSKADEYVKKIVVEGDNKLTAHIGEGTSASTKVFTKGTEGNWSEEGAS